MDQGSRPLRIGIMGGTFDPIHHGHLVAASEVQNVFDLDEVIFVPTWAQPFKRDRRVSAAEHRYLMTVIATASNNRFTVSRVDIDRGGTTYTIDTLRDIAAEYPGAELFFITGADALAQILTWKDNQEILNMAHLVGVTRPGHVLADPGLPEDGVSLVEVPAMAISSTDCCNRAGRGPVVVVAHGAAITLGTTYLLGLDPGGWFGLRGLDNCHHAVLRSGSRTPGWTLVCWNAGGGQTAGAGGAAGSGEQGQGAIGAFLA